MELNKQAIDNSIQLITGYSNRVFDKNFIRELIFIIEDSIEESVHYHFRQDIKDPYAFDYNLYDENYSKVNLYFNLEKMKQFIKNIIDKLSKMNPQIDKTILINFYAMAIVLHNKYHIDQVNMAYLDKSPYEEINELYSLFYLFVDVNNRKRIEYDNSYTFFHERNAWIQLSFDLAKIFEDTALEQIVTNFYIGYLLKDYGKDKCPVKTTFKKIGVPYDFNLKGIPFSEQFYHGFMVEPEKFNEVIAFLRRPSRYKLKVQDIDQKIRSLR